jgi:hypothetical protein
MRFEDIRKPVTPAEAREVKCPKCSARSGARCTYTTDGWHTDWTPRYETRKVVRAGEPMTMVHPERREAVRERRRRQWEADRLRTRPPVNPVSERARQARAAMLAWDAAEYAALTAWWREHGHIIANAAATRPDGSVRGRGYGIIDAERDTDRASGR